MTNAYENLIDMDVGGALSCQLENVSAIRTIRFLC